MKENKYTAEQLWDSCVTSTDILCTKCKDTKTTCGDENLSCDEFFYQGWRATPNHTYCPKCAKKYLKQ